MATEVLSRDQNTITVLGGVTDDSNQFITMLRVDPTTKRLLVSATGFSANLVIGTSTITNGTDTKILYDNNGVLGELTNNFEVTTNKATDFTTINNTLYPSVQAVNNAIITAVTGLLDYRGSYDASTNLFPATGGSGIAGAILKGDFWICSVAGTLGGKSVTPGDLIIALVDTPAQTASNWDLIEHDINGAYVTTDQTVGQTIGATGARLTKLWATDITCTNAIAGSVTGNAGTASAVAVGGITGLGTGVATALAINIGTAGAVVLNSVTTLSSLTSISTITTGGLGTGATLGSVTVNIASSAVGDIYYAGASNVLTILADVAAGQPLLSGGVTTAPGYAGYTFSATAAQTYTFPGATATLASLAGTETLTNKRVTPRILSAASYTTDTGTSIAGDSLDMFIVTAQTGALKFKNPTGTPKDGQKLIISVASSTTAARALTWDTGYGATTVALPTTTAATTVTLTIGFIWSASKSLWQCVAVA